MISGDERLCPAARTPSRPPKPYRLTLPDDRPLPDRARIVGRGADLHVFIDSAWYQLNLADLP